jgi:glycosyltransferase involved in cell wall biosynthesis
LHVIHVGPDPETIGGMQSVLRTIRDHSIGADRVSVVPTWTGPAAARNALATAKAARIILAADRTTVLHVHLSDRGAYLREPPLAALARSRGMRVVYSLHGHDFPAVARAHPRTVQIALRPAHHVTCLSEEALDAAHKAVGPTRVTLMPNPVAIDHGSPPADQTEPVILFAGVVGHRKGVDLLVDAWRLLLDEGIEGTCRIVGPIDDYRPPPLERLTVEGPADPRSVPRLLRSARVVALPSRSEQMPMILAEALAAARPFVATPVGGGEQLAPCPEMLVPIGDVRALARALGRFLIDRELARSVGRAAQAFCERTRSPQAISARLRAIYCQC